MSEQLKKIRLPLADGTVREIDIADTELVRREVRQKLDELAPVIEALELASAPNLIPPIDEWPVYGRVTLVGSKMMYSIDTYYYDRGTVLAHLGRLKGQYVFSADFGEGNGMNLRIVGENRTGASPIVEIDTENPEKTVNLDIEDAWLVLDLPARKKCLVSSAVLKLVTAKENSLAMETYRLGQKVLDLRVADNTLANDIKNVSDSLPWAGTLSEFRDYRLAALRSRSPAKVFMIFNNDNLYGLYYGGKRIFPIQTQKFSIKGIYEINDKNVGEYYSNGYESVSIVTFPIDPDTGEFDYTANTVFPMRYNGLFGGLPLIALDGITADSYFFESAASMFDHCNILERVNLSNLDTSKVTNMANMFYGCKSLESLDMANLDTSKVTTMTFMLCNCSSLKTLNVNGWDFSAVTDFVFFAANCSSITDIIGPVSGISADLSFSDSPLTNESAMVIINGLAEVAATRTLQLSAATYDTLSEQQIALATSKGWTLTRR